MKKLQNNNVIVNFYNANESGKGKPYIIASDLIDKYNEPTIYTTKIRNIALAWKFLEQIFNSYELQEDLKISDIEKILDDKFNLKTRFYCAVD